MSQALVSAGFSVMTAADGSEGVRQCRQFDPDLVLLDIEMPEMDGISACSRIRGQSNNRNLPIVMVTGRDDETSVNKAMAAGATDFIIKPINWPLFGHRINGYLASGQAGAELDASHERIDSLERVAPDLALIVTRKGVILDRLGRRVVDVVPNSPEDAATLDEIWPEPISRQMSYRISSVLKTREERNYQFELAVEVGNRQFEARFMVEGRDRVLIIVQEFTSTKSLDGEVFQLAYTDPATGLDNRYMFETNAEVCLAEARLRERSVALLVVCFDRLEGIVRECGQADTDQAYRTVALRLLDCLQNRDEVEQHGFIIEESHAARLSDDQFAILISSLKISDSAIALAEQIRVTFREPLNCSGHSFEIAPRMGIALFPEDGRDFEVLLAAATSAMQDAGVLGDARPYFFSEVSQQQAPVELDMGDELRNALDQGQLTLYYQPRVVIQSGRTIAVEALLRWEHPLRGLISPSEILPLAEAVGLLIPIGDWVLEAACGQAREWQDSGYTGLRISVNLSRQEFARRGLAERVKAALDSVALSPDCLEIEVTEASLLRGDRAMASLGKLRQMGVGIVLDDFGTGHSSLAQLRNFPLNALKIDELFVQEIGDDPAPGAICEVMIMLAHKFGLKAVAEGVETPEQLGFLRHHGCDEMQGFLISEPLPGDAIGEYLRAAWPEK